MEFLIRRADHGDWDSEALDVGVCHPSSTPFRMLSGPREEPRFEVSGTEFQFIYEMPGIQVSVEGGTLDRAQVTSILTEIVGRMGAATGTPGYLIDIDAFGGRPIAFAGPDEPSDPASEGAGRPPRKPWWKFW
jgi:hypothetical protein